MTTDMKDSYRHDPNHNGIQIRLEQNKCMISDDDHVEPEIEMEE